MQRATAMIEGLEAVLFALASLVHAGILATGYEHAKAGTAEGVIAAILAIGVLAAALAVRWWSRISLAAQILALVGTLIGAFTIVIGVGPQSGPDLAFHALILAILIGGLTYMWRARAP